MWSPLDRLCGVPLAFCKLHVKRVFLDRAQLLWSHENSCSVSRILWPYLDHKRTLFLLGLSRERLRNMIELLTGHCRFGRHASRLGLSHNDYCRICHDIEEEESITHLLCGCPALENSRQCILGRLRYDDLRDLSDIALYKLDLFIRKSNWFTR